MAMQDACPEEKATAHMTVSKQQNLSASRLFFLDNIRSVAIIFVVLFHATLSYSGGANPWWYVQDPGVIPHLMIFLIFFSVFLIPILFFISGLLASPSYDRHGPSSFLKSKFQRLALPLLICTFLFSPVMPYIRQVLRALDSGSEMTGFWEFWLQYLQSGSRLYAGSVIQSTQLVVTQYWFLMVLFFFFAAFALYREGKKKFRPGRTNHRPAGTPSRAAIYIALAATGLITGVVYFLACNLINTTVWVTLGDLFQLQPARMPIYAAVFILGILIHRKGWLDPLLHAGHPVAWLAVSSLMTFVYLILVGRLPTAPGLLFITCLFRIFLVLSVLIFSISFFHRFLNRSTLLWRELSANSYNMYLIHLVPLVVFQLLFLRFSMPPLLKFGIISALTLLLSYGISRFLVRKSGYATVLALVLLFLAMCFFF